jgi:hypothetical protein
MDVGTLVVSTKLESLVGNFLYIRFIFDFEQYNIVFV